KAYTPVIGLWPGVDLSFIKQAQFRAQCTTTCEYEKWDPTVSYAAVLIDGHEATMDAILSINGTTTVLVFIEPMKDSTNDTLLEIIDNVTSIIGYHPKSAYHLAKDAFDRIESDFSRPINNIWLEEQKDEVYRSRQRAGMYYNRDIAFVRNCAKTDPNKFEKKFEELSDSYHRFNWRYKVHKVDVCEVDGQEVRREKIKVEIAKFDTFILDKHEHCDEFYPEIQYAKGLSIPIITSRSPIFPESSTLTDDELKAGTRTWKKDQYFAWTESYTRTPFHGRGICEICEILANNETLVYDINIEPYFACTSMTVVPKAPEGEPGPKPKVTEMP
ncbi:hypothetical protein PENTCL1PPCAC_28904, partial [Pristionchus entomophagus]